MHQQADLEARDNGFVDLLQLSYYYFSIFATNGGFRRDIFSF